MQLYPGAKPFSLFSRSFYSHAARHSHENQQGILKFFRNARQKKSSIKQRQTSTPDNITIQEAESKHYSSIHGLIINELGYDQLDFEELIIRLELMKADDKYLTVVAEMEGRVVGFVGLYKGIAYNIDGEYLQISALAVLKDRQNKGIGKRILKWVEEYAANNDIQNIVLTSRLHRTDAHAFYEKNGYEKKSYGFKKYL